MLFRSFGISGALLGTVVATALTVPLAVYVVRVDRASWRGATRILHALRADVGTALWGLTAFWVLAEVDVALARHYLSGDDAGFYSSAGLMARAPLFIAAAVGVVAFPRFVAGRTNEASLHRWLRVSVTATAGIGALCVGVLVLLREPLISLAFGESFVPGADLLPLLATAMACLAVVSVLVYFHIAVGSRAYVIGGEVAGQELDTIQSVDLTNGRTRIVGHLPRPLGHAMAASIGGRILLMGGRTTPTSTTDAMWWFDPATRRVRPAGHLPIPLSDAAVAAHGNRIWLLGGETPDITDAVTTVILR